MDPRSRTGEGFTIIEVVVAVTILIVALLGAALLFSNAVIVSGNTRNRVVATNLATADMIISSPLLAGDYENTRPDLSPRAWEGETDA